MNFWGAARLGRSHRCFEVSIESSPLYRQHLLRGDVGLRRPAGVGRVEVSSVASPSHDRVNA